MTSEPPASTQMIDQVITHADVAVRMSGDRLKLRLSAEMIEKLLRARSPGIIGAITGRAIYEGTLDVAEAQAFCDSFTG